MENSSITDRLPVLNTVKEDKFGGGEPWEKRSATNRQITGTEKLLQNEVFQVTQIK